MEQIPIRTLNQDTAGVLARVQNGEIIEITNRGHAVARLIPAPTGALDDLVAAGLVVPPTIAGPIPVPTVAATDGSEAGELLSSLREEERW